MTERKDTPVVRPRNSDHNTGAPRRLVPRAAFSCLWWRVSAVGLLALSACAETVFTTYQADYRTLVPARPAASARRGTALLEIDFGSLDRVVERRPPPTRQTHPSVWRHPYAWQGGINSAVMMAVFNVVQASFDVVRVEIVNTEEWDLDEPAISVAMPVNGRVAAPPDYRIRIHPRSIRQSGFGYVQGGLTRPDAVSQEIAVSFGLAVEDSTGTIRAVDPQELHWRASDRTESWRSTILLTESLMRTVLLDMQERLDAELRVARRD